MLQGLDPAFARSREHIVEIWPETLPAIQLFLSALTQWRMSSTGPVGLDYLAVDLLMTYQSIPLPERAALLQDIACLERGYLSALRR